MLHRIEQAGLAELLEEPIIALLMRRDGVDRHGLVRLLDDVGREMTRAAAAPAAAGGSRRSRPR